MTSPQPDEDLPALDLESAGAEIQTLRNRLLFDFTTDHLSPEAEQHLLLCLAALDTAKRFMSLAELSQTRAIAARSRGF